MKEKRERCDRCCKWQIHGELYFPEGFDYLGIALCQPCIEKPPAEGWVAWKETRKGYIHPEYR